MKENRSLSDPAGEHGGDKASRSRMYARGVVAARRNETGNEYPAALTQPVSSSVGPKKRLSAPEDVRLVFDDGFLEQQEMLLRQYEDAKSNGLAPAPTPRLQLNSNRNEGNYEARFTRPTANESVAVTQKEHLLDFSDPVIREQKRIYEEIQSLRQREKDIVQHQHDFRTREESALELTHRSTPSPNENFRREIPRKQGASVKGKVDATVPDQVEHLVDGKKLRIKGTHHVVRSIEKGEAVIVMCPSPSCKAVLQIDKNAKNVFCVFCRQVSPLSSAHTALNSSRLLPTQHESIARSVQRQEIDVAAARKAAKLARNAKR